MALVILILGLLLIYLGLTNRVSSVAKVLFGTVKQ